MVLSGLLPVFHPQESVLASLWCVMEIRTAREMDSMNAHVKLKPTLCVKSTPTHPAVTSLERGGS